MSTMKMWQAAALAVLFLNTATALSPVSQCTPNLRPAFVEGLDRFLADVKGAVSETQKKLEATRMNLMDRFGLSHHDTPALETAETALEASTRRRDFDISAGNLGRVEKMRRTNELIQKYRLTEEELGKLKSSFEVFDKDSDGQISEDEFIEAMEAYGHKKKSRAEVHKMMLEVDVDGSRQIEYDEFVQMMAPRVAAARSNSKMSGGKMGVDEKSKRLIEAMNRYGLSGADLEKISKSFNAFDKNGDGRISLDEMGKSMAELGHLYTQEELKGMLESVDADGSGEVEYDEFVSLMGQKIAARRR
jgi:Ca2+-binding EF-hand superfamily protein